MILGTVPKKLQLVETFWDCPESLFQAKILIFETKTPRPGHCLQKLIILAFYFLMKIKIFIKSIKFF